MIRLLELRAEKSLSQREMARVMHVSQGTYNNWEQGRTQPCIEQLIGLAHFFAVTVDYLIGDTDEYGTVQAGSSLSGEERLLLNRFRMLEREAQDSLLAFLENVTNRR